MMYWILHWILYWITASSNTNLADMVYYKYCNGIERLGTVFERLSNAGMVTFVCFVFIIKIDNGQPPAAALKQIFAFMLVRKKERDTLISWFFLKKITHFLWFLAEINTPFQNFLLETINYNFKMVKLRISPCVNYVQYKHRHAVWKKHLNQYRWGCRVQGRYIIKFRKSWHYSKIPLKESLLLLLYQLEMVRSLWQAAKVN